jgi:hypothetical protein
MAIAALLLILIAAFDWNWLRDPLNAYVTRKTHREFTSSDLHVRLGMTPTIRLRNVVFANAPWAGSAPMAKFGVLEFSVSLRDLFDGKILVPRVALTDSDLRFERLPDGRKNWKLSDPSDTSPSRLRISSLSVTRGSAQYIDHSIPFALRIAVSTFDPNARSAASDADAPPVNERYTTQYAFDGTYRDAKFAGTALTGDVLSFQESGINFPDPRPSGRRHDPARPGGHGGRCGRAQRDRRAAAHRRTDTGQPVPVSAAAASRVAAVPHPGASHAARHALWLRRDPGSDRVDGRGGQCRVCAAAASPIAAGELAQ